MPVRASQNITAVALAFTVAIAGHASAVSVIFVDDDASAGGDGLTWRTAMRHLQDALALASQPGSGISEIRVAQGTYAPDRSSANPAGSGDRDASFALVGGVAIRGGFQGPDAGALDDPNRRDISEFPTILCGDLAGDDGDDFAGSLENSYQVVTAVKVPSSAVLDGFTICRGRADGVSLGATPQSKDQGAGINIYHSAPQLLNLTLQDNWSANHGCVNDHGDATLIHCTFRNNYATLFGPGLYIHHMSSTQAINCRFEHNDTPGEGGGVYSRSHAAARITGCDFLANSAGLGGGAYTNEGSTIVISACTFIDNTAIEGGGVYNNNGTSTVENCFFSGNDAALGGGVFNNRNEPLVRGCFFLGNSASFGDPGAGAGGGGGTGGGGVWNEAGAPRTEDCLFVANTASFGGGLYNHGQTTAVTVNCSFIDNIALEGGGAYSLISDTVFIDCTFRGNSTEPSEFSVGAGLSNYFCSPIIVGCDFIRNSAEDFGGGMFSEGEFPVITDCTFLGNRAGAGGGMNNFRSCPLITNCLFVGNVADSNFFSLGGGLYNNFLADPVVTNCTFVSNQAGSGGGIGMFRSAPLITNCTIWANTADQVAQDLESDAVLNFCDVQGGWLGSGADNFDVDPQFVSLPHPGSDGRWSTQDDQYGDLHLTRGSQVIDAGDSAALPAGLTTDLDGLPRFAGLAVDLGAFEVQPNLSKVADLNGDGLVNGFDLGILLSAWGTDRPAADLNGDGIVGPLDLAILLANWTI